MEFIDTHIHLQDYKQKCATEIIASALKAGCKKLVCAAVVESDWQNIALLFQQYPEIIIPAFGCHPWYIERISENWEQRLEQMLKQFPCALVGETGLDRIHHQEKEPQLAFFKTQIALAQKYRRPLLVHAVKVNEWLEDCWNILPQKFVMHSFNGRQELLQKALKAGGYISFSASILRNRDKEQLIRSVPVDKLLVETDGPYQAIEKDIESEPMFIPALIRQLAKIRGDGEERLAQQIYQNSLEFIKAW